MDAEIVGQFLTEIAFLERSACNGPAVFYRRKSNDGTDTYGSACGSVPVPGADSGFRRRRRSRGKEQFNILDPSEEFIAVPIKRFVVGHQLQTERLFALDVGEGELGVYDHDTAQAASANRPPYLTIPHLWQQDMVLYLTEDATYKERLHLLLSIECDLNYSIIQRIEYPATLVPTFTFYANDLELQYTFGNFERPWLQVAAGYFPFKYNPDARNLGEFLLRSSAYPTIIVSSPFFPLTRELGVHFDGVVGDPAFDQVRWDLLLTSETHDWPVLDGTVTGVLSNKLFSTLDVGGGVSFQRLFPVDKTKTTVKDTRTMFLEQNADTAYYTFQSIKLMGRAAVTPLHFVPEFTIPPAFLFGNRPFFKREDLKIYGEVAVLGTQDYVAYDSFAQSATVNPNTGDSVFSNVPGTGKKLGDSLNYYNNVKDRMPIMLGINVPTNPIISYGILPFILTKWLKDETGSSLQPLPWITLVPALLSGVAQHYFGWDLGPDVLSLEFEWFSQRYTNSDRKAINPSDKIPLPYLNSDRNQANFGTPEPTKYSLYFSKVFLGKFALSGLVGRDHFKPIVFGNPSINQTDDFLQAKTHWYWTMRLSANF